ncbi:putative endo-beta-1,4-glucanase D [Colletotrichum tanaceti]|uniref:lytic cellulose monooxygenase (C4-dehydrogenating) n=1 Tax=Colletotrichum tanaceti TaxID=1306861 RepID=A0A4U6XPS9_9PEZI|nr:putative endo-beta-1,4-glucanase D [Colletotrichum tanaceti]
MKERCLEISEHYSIKNSLEVMLNQTQNLVDMYPETSHPDLDEDHFETAAHLATKVDYPLLKLLLSCHYQCADMMELVLCHTRVCVKSLAAAKQQGDDPHQFEVPELRMDKNQALEMKFLVVVSLVPYASAHYIFPSVTYNGKTMQDWEFVRKTANFQSNGPVTDVTSSQMTCYQLAPGSQGAKVLDVTAGSILGYNVKASVSHPGPVNFYMAKALAGTSITNWDGSGRNWFKIYNDGPTVGPSGLAWPTDGKTTLNVQIPKCLADGEYFLRVEHVALHGASSPGGAKLYISCAQLRVSEGTGTYKPNLMSFPGAYSANDPGLLVGIYYPVPTNYKAPGGAPLAC